MTLDVRVTGPAWVRRARRAQNLCVAVLLSGCATQPSAPPPRSSPRIVAYLAAWDVRNKGLRITDIPGGDLTHVCYAFGRISSEGRAELADPCLDAGECGPVPELAPGGSFAQLRLLKRRFPHLRVLISLGGWGGSKYFSDAAATPEARHVLVASTIDLFMRRFAGLFDGVDLDWEFPVAGGLPENRYRREDQRNYTLLVAEFRRQLGALGEREGRRYELTIAASARPWEIANLELTELSRYLDWFNVMTYDYHSVDTIAHFNAPLYAATGDPTPALNVDASLAIFVEARVPTGQLVLGIPFYGRGYGGVAAERDGLFQRAAYSAAGEWGTGGIDYRTLVSKEPERHGFGRHWHPQAKVPWLYNPETQVWISYDDSQSVRLKAEYARQRGLGGVMFWELGGDDGTLLRAVRRGLTAEESR